MKKRRNGATWRQVMALVLSVIFILGSGIPAQAKGTSVVALGADLNAEQRATVLELLGLTEESLEECTVVTVTNEQEHQYLDAYLDASIIGTRSLSSVKVTPLREGEGIHVTTHNISYCTISMYQNALVTAGLSDAEVIVAGPSPISGTAALIGAVEAYEALTGESVEEHVLETATNELVLTGELGDLLGDSEEASEIIAYIKQQILEADASTQEEIEAIIRQVLAQYGVELSDADLEKILSLMEKFSKLDIDVDALAKQAKDLYEKVQGMGLEVDSEKVGNFFTNLLKGLLKFLEEII